MRTVAVHNTYVGLARTVAVHNSTSAEAAWRGAVEVPHPAPQGKLHEAAVVPQPRAQTKLEVATQPEKVRPCIEGMTLRPTGELSLQNSF